MKILIKLICENSYKKKDEPDVSFLYQHENIKVINREEG